MQKQHDHPAKPLAIGRQGIIGFFLRSVPTRCQKWKGHPNSSHGASTIVNTERRRFTRVLVDSRPLIIVAIDIVGTMKVSTVFSCVVAALSCSSFSNAQATCIETIDEIYTAEASVTNTAVRRTYVMCPRRILEIGTLTHNFDLQNPNAHPPLPLRPNMTIQCGDTGSRDNICWITGGDIHVDGTPFRGISDPTIEGVEISGITFLGARMYSVWLTKSGDVTFNDCEWKVRPWWWI